MKWFIALLSLSVPAFGGYDAARPILIDHTQIGSSDASNFTVLIAGTWSYLAAVANSGNIRHTVSCGVNLTCPADLIYTSDGGCNNLLSWEIESYSGSTGLIAVWVKVPSISHIIDTTIYECYGNAAVTAFQGTAAGAAWNSNFKLVQHMPNGTTLQLTDSTVNGNTTTANNASAAAGKIGGGVNFIGNSASNLSVANSPSLDSTTGTWSGWINTSQSVAGLYPLLWARADSASSQRGISLFLEASTARLRVQVYSASSLVLDLAGGVALNDGAWHHVAFTFSDTGVSKLFVDGSPVASASPSAAWSFSGQVLRTASALDPFWTPLNGTIDEFELSNTARSEDWLLAEYNNQNSPSTFYTVGDEIGSPGVVTPKGGSQPFIG